SHEIPFKCPVEGCTINMAEGKDLDRHIWTHHPDYAQEKNINDRDRTACYWPWCRWRGRSDNLKRHRD
ncbi:hypothetical protein QBC36DRAFT_149311, partial [Triangularia setosa]